MRELKKPTEAELRHELRRIMRKYPELSSVKISRGSGITEHMLITVVLTDHNQVNLMVER